MKGHWRRNRGRKASVKQREKSGKGETAKKIRDTVAAGSKGKKKKPVDRPGSVGQNGGVTKPTEQEKKMTATADQTKAQVFVSELPPKGDSVRIGNYLVTITGEPVKNKKEGSGFPLQVNASVWNGEDKWDTVLKIKEEKGQITLTNNDRDMFGPIAMRIARGGAVPPSLAATEKQVDFIADLAHDAGRTFESTTEAAIGISLSPEQLTKTVASRVLDFLAPKPKP